MQILRPKLLEEFVNDIEESVKASGKMKAGNLSVKWLRRGEAIHWTEHHYFIIYRRMC